MFKQPFSRRAFLKLSAATAAVALAARWLAKPRLAQADPVALPTRPLGKTGVSVTILGLGGEGVLRTWDQHDAAVAVIRRAVERGITYCDTAPAYSASQDYYGRALGANRARVFLASKTHDRTRDGSLRLLEDSLRRLRTDHLDLWQLHDLETMEELEAIFGDGGAIHALEQAKRQGLVRFAGITGHYDPAVLAEAIRRYPFDTVLVALHAADRARRSFIEELLPVANTHRMGIIGMKVFAKGSLLHPETGLTATHALNYVLNLPISTSIIGFRGVEEVDQAVEIARHSHALSPEDMAHIEALAAPYAHDANGFKRA